MQETELGLELCFLIFILLLISLDPLPNEHNLLDPEWKPQIHWHFQNQWNRSEMPFVHLSLHPLPTHAANTLAQTPTYQPWAELMPLAYQSSVASEVVSPRLRWCALTLVCHRTRHEQAENKNSVLALLQMGGGRGESLASVLQRTVSS